MNWIGRLLRLTGGERRLLARASAHLVAARLRLAWRPARCLHPKSPRAVPARQEFTAAQAAWAVEAAARALPRTRCLARAVALRTLLGAGGFAARLRLGVAGDGSGGIRAHAWVECDGATFDCGEDSRGYAPFPALPD